MTTELKPCPWCGLAGDTIGIRHNGRVWDGMKWSTTVSVSVVHWCPQEEGQPSRMIERVGRDEGSALYAWNARTEDAEIERLRQQVKELQEQIDYLLSEDLRDNGYKHS